MSDLRDIVDPYVAEALYEETIAWNVDARGGTASESEWPSWEELPDLAREHWMSMAVTARVAGNAARGKAVGSPRVIGPGVHYDGAVSVIRGRYRIEALKSVDAAIGRVPSYETCVIHLAPRAVEEDRRVCWKYDGQDDCRFTTTDEVPDA